MWIWKADYEKLINKLLEAKVGLAEANAGVTMLREQCALLTHMNEVAEERNQSLFDAHMQIKHQHPGTGYQDAMKTMFQDGETIMHEDPEELRKYHKRMQDLQDEGADPGLVLLEEMDDLRSEDSLFGPGLPDES